MSIVNDNILGCFSLGLHLKQTTLTSPFWCLLDSRLDLFQGIGWDTVDQKMERKYE